MPAYCVTRVQDLLNERGKALKGARVLVLGVAYKADVSDMRESPAVPVIEGLLRKGASVEFHDPHVSSVAIGDTTLESVPIEARALAAVDMVVLVTPHRAIDFDAVAAAAPLVFDTRHVLRGRYPNVVRL